MLHRVSGLFPLFAFFSGLDIVLILKPCIDTSTMRNVPLMFYSQLCKQKFFLTLSVNYCVRSLQYILGTKCSKFCDCKRNPAMLPMRLNHFSTFFSMVLFVFPFCYKTPKKIFGIFGRMSINAPLNVRSKVKALPGGERGEGGGGRGTADFKWRGWSNGGKNQSPQKSVGLPTYPATSLDQTSIPAKIQQPQN